MKNKRILPPGGVPRVLRECRKIIIDHPGSTREAIVAETLVRVLLGERKGNEFITHARYLALRDAQIRARQEAQS